MTERYEPDYRQAAVTGKRWRRSLHGEFSNPFEGGAWIRFDWEDRVLLDDGTTVATPAPSTLRHFDTPSAKLDILNPETGEPTGQVITHAALYAILWSLARESASLQDKEEQRAAEAEAQAKIEEANLGEDDRP